MKEAALKAYKAMVMARAFDTKTSALYKAGKILGGVFLGRGHEAIAACEEHGRRGLSTYKCSYCNGWHLTSHPWT